MLHRIVCFNNPLLISPTISKKDQKMSDKFFFSGLQDSRQDHAGGAYKTNAGSNSGSEKYPLALVVTSEARQQEVQALVDEAQLHARISIDSSEDAKELPN